VIAGELLFAGDAGLEARDVGSAGAVVSYVNETVEATEAFAAVSVTCTRTV
jgi:hypothetical protein